MGAVDRVRDIVEPIVVGRGDLELYDIEHESGVLRVAIDRPGGIDVETLGELSQRISAALDADDPFPGSRYLLEVTSPGIERKLRTPAHFQSRIGEDVLVKLKPRAEAEGQRRLSGRLDAAGEQGIDVSVDDGDGSTLHLLYADIEAARTVFHWGESSTRQKNPASKTTKKKVAAR